MMKMLALLFAILPLAGCQSTGAPEIPTDQTVQGPVEPVTGLPKDGLHAIIRLGKLNSIFFNPAKISEPQLKLAAQRLCGGIGSRVDSADYAELHHPDQFPPNTKHYIIHCR